MKKWFYVYVLELSNGRLYIGCTKNLREGLEKHNQGRNRVTKKLLPLRLCWVCSYPNLKMALSFEAFLKSATGRDFAKKHFISEVNSS